MISALKQIAIAGSVAVATLCPIGLVQAEGSDNKENGQQTRLDERRDAQQLVDEAETVARQMKADPELANLLSRAKGVFIVPDYARAAAVAGGEGGEGVLLAKNGQDWSDPVFYNIGAATAGAQLGVSTGSIAMILMTEKAVDSFKQDNNFAVNADAGFTMVDYSARSHGSTIDGDVVLWSDTEGAFANVSVGITDIQRDDSEIKQYYRETVDAASIIEGNARSDQQVAQNLKRALSS